MTKKESFILSKWEASIESAENTKLLELQRLYTMFGGVELFGDPSEEYLLKILDICPKHLHGTVIKLYSEFHYLNGRESAAKDLRERMHKELF